MTMHNKVVNDQKHPYFEIGNWYDFVVKNKLNLPDNSTSLVLIDEKGIMHLLPYTLYAAYGIEPGQTIRCKVDKINCTGKVFLEPAHPRFMEGETYPFRRVSVVEAENEAGERIKRLLVEDDQNQEFTIDLLKNQYDTGIPDTITCRVRLIRKAKVFLNWIDEENEKIHAYETGKLYDFVVSEIHHSFENETYIVLTGKDNHKHVLKEKHYRFYTLTPGSIIQCEFRGYNERHRLILEPVHPVYIPGKLYSFKGFWEVVGNENHLILIDVFDNQIDMGVETQLTPDSGDTEFQAEIVRIHKGIPVLKRV